MPYTGFKGIEYNFFVQLILLNSEKIYLIKLFFFTLFTFINKKKISICLFI